MNYSELLQLAKGWGNFISGRIIIWRLRSILVQNTPQPGMIADIQSTAEMAKVAEQLKYATIVVSSLPLLVMYPFFQKYFDKGIMVGSVKG